MENTDTKIDQDRAARLIESIENDLRSLRSIVLVGHDTSDVESMTLHGFMQVHSPEEDEAIEGNFDGERMIDYNGKSYQVPPNYASKSKLIEGDPLKLYITRDGKYL